MYYVNLLFIFLVLVSSVVSAEIVCLDKSSRMYLRNACKKSETQVDFGSLGITGAQGPKGDKGETGTPGKGIRFVTDSNGHKVAEIVTWLQPGHVHAIAEVAGEEYLLNFNISDVVGFQFTEQTDLLWWETTDCSGQPLFREEALTNALPNSFAEPGTTFGPLRALYRVDRTNAPFRTTLRSYRAASGPACHISPTPLSAKAIHAILIGNLIEMFPPPYALGQ